MAASTSTRSATSSGSLHSSGEWLTSPAPLRTKEHPAADAGGGKHARVVAGPGDKLGCGQAAPLELFPQHSPHPLVHACRLGDQRGVESDRCYERIEPFPVGCARVDAEDRAPGDHVLRTRHNLQSTHGRDGLRGPRWRRRGLGGRVRPLRTTRRAGLVPACPAAPCTTTSPRATPTMPVTTPSGVDARSRTGPCSMCAST